MKDSIHSMIVPARAEIASHNGYSRYAIEFRPYRAQGPSRLPIESLERGWACSASGVDGFPKRVKTAEVESGRPAVANRTDFCWDCTVQHLGGRPCGLGVGLGLGL